MKRLRFLSLLLGALAALVSLAPFARAAAADAANVQVLLVVASNEKGPADRRLAPYEAELQRNLPESSFRLAGEGSATVTGDRPVSVALAQGHRIEFRREAGGGIALAVQWKNGNETLVRGTMHAVPGKPFVMLWRPKSGSEVPLVIVVAK